MNLIQIFLFVFAALQGVAALFALIDRYAAKKGIGMTRSEKTSFMARIRPFLQWAMPWMVLAYTILGAIVVTNLRRELKSLRETGAFKPTSMVTTDTNRPIATAEELAQETIIGRTIFVPAIPTTSFYFSSTPIPMYMVLGKRFEDCDFIGPGTIKLVEASVVTRCAFASPFFANRDKFNACSLLQQDSAIVGVTVMSHCIIQHCRFRDVAFAGTAEELQVWKSGFKQ